MILYYIIDFFTVKVKLNLYLIYCLHVFLLKFSYWNEDQKLIYLSKFMFSFLYKLIETNMPSLTNPSF